MTLSYEGSRCSQVNWRNLNFGVKRSQWRKHGFNHQVTNICVPGTDMQTFSNYWGVFFSLGPLSQFPSSLVKAELQKCFPCITGEWQKSHKASSFQGSNLWSLTSQVPLITYAPKSPVSWPPWWHQLHTNKSNFICIFASHQTKLIAQQRGVETPVPLTGLGYSICIHH